MKKMLFLFIVGIYAIVCIGLTIAGWFMENPLISPEKPVFWVNFIVYIYLIFNRPINDFIFGEDEH